MKQFYEGDLCKHKSQNILFVVEIEDHPDYTISHVNKYGDLHRFTTKFHCLEPVNKGNGLKLHT